jgi:hypothetical protein
MMHFTVTDTETGIVSFDSAWPQIKVSTTEEAFAISADMLKYDNGVISADTFFDRHGVHPDANWSIVIESKE